MKVKKVELFNYRNYLLNSIEFGDGLNVIEGHNAQGKTNLIEAVYFCAVGKSFRATREKEVLNWDKDVAKIKLTIEKEIGKKVIEIIFSKNQKKTVKIDGIPIKKIGELMGELTAVFFAPDELKLIKESPESYFEVLSRTLEFILFTLAVPYSILALSIKIYDLQNQKTESVNAARMRFYDVNRNLKLVVTADSILYIAAEENYINIYYTDNGKVKCYVLRNSMRSVDELCLSNGLVRCHRSFYVNPSHVRVLRKEKEGIVSAELDMDDLRDIPVSKTYYKNLAEML